VGCGFGIGRGYIAFVQGFVSGGGFSVEIFLDFSLDVWPISVPGV
jgi:hypothetical protein